MEIYIISFIIVLIMMLAMAVGSLLGRNGIGGGCGGAYHADDEQKECGMCSCDSKCRSSDTK